VRHLMLIPLLLGCATWSRSLRFFPDTICAGTGTGCTYSARVRNLTQDSVVSNLAAELSPVPVPNRVGFNTGGTSSYGFEFDSIAKAPVGYVLRGRSTFWLGQKFVLKVGPNSETVIQRCDVGYPYLLTAAPSRRNLAERAATEATTPTQLGNGEVIGLVFTTTKGDSDTLYVRVNEWLKGAGLRPRIKARNPLAPGFTADGKTTLPQSKEVRFGPDGAHPVLR
jgi:hypothetical protein